MTVMTNTTISRQCGANMHASCAEPQSCACPGCHQSCDRCGGTDLQNVQGGVCASCRRVAASRTAGASTPCDNDPQHGRGVRNPATRRDEFYCLSCHAKSGDGLAVRERDLSLIAPCAGQDVASDQHRWHHVRGSRFGCICGASLFDKKRVP